MSAKISRPVQFCQAFDGFITQHFIDTGKLDTWNILLITENIRTNIHTYKLSIPHSHIAYYLHNTITLSDGTTQGPGAVYLPQIRPELTEFRQVFCDYFRQFELMANNKSLSGVHFHKSIETTAGDIEIELVVVYYKKWKPYPVQLTREEELENQLQGMTNRAIVAEEDYARVFEYYQNHRNYRERQTDKLNKLERVFRKIATEAYVSGGELQDCPVCFDPITIDALHITLCGHYICNECNSKCSKCPLCRETY